MFKFYSKVISGSDCTCSQIRFAKPFQNDWEEAAPFPGLRSAKSKLKIAKYNPIFWSINLDSFNLILVILKLFNPETSLALLYFDPFQLQIDQHSNIALLLFYKMFLLIHWSQQSFAKRLGPHTDILNVPYRHQFHFFFVFYKQFLHNIQMQTSAGFELGSFKEKATMLTTRSK